MPDDGSVPGPGRDDTSSVIGHLWCSAGQIAVQMLTALTGATVIATDMRPDAMQRAEESGAISVPGGDDQVAAIRDLTGGRGVDAALDFVGVTPTIKTAQACMAQGGRPTVVGIAGGVTEWSFSTTPYESTINTYWGSIEDLYEVVAMYRAGQIRPDIERFAMDDALEAYRASKPSSCRAARS